MTKLRYHDGKDETLIKIAYDMIRLNEEIITKNQALLIILAIENIYDEYKMREVQI